MHSNSPQKKSNNHVLLTKIINNHLIFFSFTVIVIHIISVYLIPYSVDIYQLCLFSSTYSYINGTITGYQLLTGAMISTFVGYGITVLFSKYLSNTFIVTIICFVTLLIMTITNTLSISTLSYALGAPKLVDKLKKGYIVSFIIALLIIMVVFYFYTLLFNGVIQPWLVKNFDKNIAPIDVRQKTIDSLQHIEK